MKTTATIITLIATTMLSLGAMAQEPTDRQGGRTQLRLHTPGTGLASGEQARQDMRARRGKASSSAQGQGTRLRDGSHSVQGAGNGESKGHSNRFARRGNGLGNGPGNRPANGSGND